MEAVTGAGETAVGDPGLRVDWSGVLPEWNQMQVSFVFPSPEEKLVDPVSNPNSLPCILADY